MSKTRNELSSLTALLLALMAIPGSALAAPLLHSGEAMTAIRTGSERSVASIIDEIMFKDGISLERVSDVDDGLWSLLGGTTGSVLARARFAGYGSTFGFLPGTAAGLDGFQGLLGSLSRNGLVDNSGSPLVFPELSGDFRLAISTPAGQIWSSRARDNIDSTDHMVTWVNAADPYHYYVAFEDLQIPGADRDYNDFVLELRNFVDGPESLPEPGSLALIGLGLAGLRYVWRRKKGRDSGANA